MTDDIDYIPKPYEAKSGSKSQKNKKLTVSEIHRATTICIRDRLRRKIPIAKNIDF